MKMTELLLAIGDDNIEFQNLDHCATDLRYSAKSKSRITFVTEGAITLDGTEKLGLVIWLDRKAVADARAALSVAAPSTPAKALEDAAKAGWVACRKQVYALREDTEAKYGAITSADNVQGAFARGRCKEAKSIADALGALGPENCDELAAMLAARKQEQQ